MHFPGPLIVPLLAVKQLAAAVTWEIKVLFFNGPPNSVVVIAVEFEESGWRTPPLTPLPHPPTQILGQ